MKQIHMLVLFTVLICACVYQQEQRRNNVIILKNNQVEVGIIPDLGGRIVLLRKPGLENIFKSDTTCWNDPAVRPDISAFSEFQAFNGHIVWLSPQSEWWIKQDINTERRDQGSVWPPDPYLIYGNYRINKQSRTDITMLGPESPVSGLQLTKRIEILPAGDVNFHTSARNIRSDTLSWGLWMNTRLDGFARCYVPASPERLKRLTVSESSIMRPIPHKFLDGYFTLYPFTPDEEDEKVVQKAFINPDRNCIFAFCDHQMIKISFEPADPDSIHPEQAAVEIYNSCSSDANLLELEIHGPYRLLKPGESLSLSETWALYEYPGKNDTRAQIEFLKNITEVN